MRRKQSTICWISSTRYRQPLDSTNARKWQLLAQLPDYRFFVIGFSDSLRPRRFVEHVHFSLLPQPGSALLRYVVFFLFSPLLLAWLMLRQRGAIIVAQSPFEGAAGAAVKSWLRIFGLRPRLIVENHNNFEQDLFLQRDIPLPALYKRLMLAAARYAFRHADALRVISDSTADTARRFAPHLPQQRFMAFSDTDIFRRMQRRIPVDTAQDVVYAGVLIPRKGLHHLLPAFAQLGHAQSALHLVGKAENRDYAAALQEQAQSLGIVERVHFHGAVSQSELAECFASARVMVLPSLSEGLGRVIIEAMLLGTPVIGSRVGGIPDLIVDGETGLLVDAGDESALAAALQRIFAINPQAMGARARAFALDYFSPEHYVESYRQLFELAESGRAEAHPPYPL